MEEENCKYLTVFFLQGCKEQRAPTSMTAQRGGQKCQQ
uniref:Uncharacterized protein n=1 Tax=Arundo donax TaxID=35708 RepID=A0A0A9ADJ0_ARUDO